MVAAIPIDGIPRDVIAALRKTRCGMIDRCYNCDCDKFRYYGAVGVTVCDEWIKSPTPFIRWAVRTGYQLGLGIDRRDPFLGYSPGNCRWVTRSQQSANRRKWGSCSRFKGVSKARKKWRSIVTCNGVEYRMGVFDREEDAARAYDAKALELFGEFSRLNFPVPIN